MDPFHLGDYVFVLRVKPKFCIDLLTNVNHVLENFFFWQKALKTSFSHVSKSIKMCLDLCLDARSICGFTEASILSNSLLLHYSRCRLSLIYGKYFIFYRSFFSWICKAVTWQICQMYLYAWRNFNYLLNIFSVTPTTWLPSPFLISV